MIVERLPIGPMQNVCYLLKDPKTKTTWVVDPAWDPEKIIERGTTDGHQLSGLILTHSHYDHANAVDALLERFDIPVVAHPDEIAFSQSGNGIVSPLRKNVKEVRDGETLLAGENTITFYHTPGHAPGSLCLSVDQHLLTGDTLFIGGCGRTDIPGGDAGLLFKSLQKIAALPGSLVVCPGHDYDEVLQRPLEEEIRMNPYLHMKKASEFINAFGPL